MDYKGDLYYINQVLEGRILAFSHLAERHKDNIYNLAFRICCNREEAEEVAQDAFLKAYRSLKEFRMKSSFSTWLYRITYNTAISYLRQRKKGLLSLEDFPADMSDFAALGDADEDSEAEYRNSLINFALQKIEEQERALICLYYYDELSAEEISEITGLSKSNIKVRLFRTRQKLLEIIQKVEKNNTEYHEKVSKQ